MKSPRNTMKLAMLTAAVGLIFLTFTSPTRALSPDEVREPQKLPSITLRAGMHVIKAEVAQSQRELMIGLMWRKSLGPNEGMLFVFPQAGKQCFWMKNTLIPLSIAFVADDGRVVNTDEMQPQTTVSHCSKEPVRYVLEMNKGWFSKKGIQPGSRLTGRPFTPS